MKNNHITVTSFNTIIQSKRMPNKRPPCFPTKILYAFPSSPLGVLLVIHLTFTNMTFLIPFREKQLTVKLLSM